MKGGSKVVIEPHRHEGVFIARGKEDALVTLNSTPGVAVYGEKRISVESPPGPDGITVKVEYRVWNPFRSKSEFVNGRDRCVNFVAMEEDYTYYLHTSSYPFLDVELFCDTYIPPREKQLPPQSWVVSTTFG